MDQQEDVNLVQQAWEGLSLPHLTQNSMLTHYLNISRSLAGQTDFAAIIRAISGEIAQLVPYDHMDICIKSLDGRFHIAYEDGMDSLWSQQPPTPLTSSPIRTLLIGDVDHLITDDASEDPRFHFEGSLSSPIIQLALRSRIHVPLKVQGDIIGALSCSSRRPRYYIDHHLEKAQAVADLLAPYFFAIRASEQAYRSAIEEAAANARAEGLRSGALQLTQALEAERQRIGMDLHDQTLADLTRMSRRLTRLSHLPEIGGDALTPVLNSLQICMQDLRQIIDDAKPSILQLFGLVEAVETLLEKSIRDNSASIDWHIDDQTEGLCDTLDESVTIALFRIIQEALNNAVRHAQASCILVSLRIAQGVLCITVSDDGIGIGESSRHSGQGLINMHTRARLIGADLATSCADKHGGTSISIHLSIPAPEGDQ